MWGPPGPVPPSPHGLMLLCPRVGDSWDPEDTGLRGTVGLRAPACHDSLDTGAVLCPIIVFMLTLLIKSAPCGDGRDYSRDRSAGISKCVQEVGAPLAWAGGGRRSPGAGEGPRQGVATLGTLSQRVPCRGGCGLVQGHGWGHTLFPQAALPAMGVGAGRRLGTGFLYRGQWGHLLSSHRPSSLDLRPPGPLVLGPLSTCLLEAARHPGAPTSPPHTLCLFLSHHNYVPHLLPGGPGPPRGPIWGDVGKTWGCVSLLAPPSPRGALLQL